MDDRRDPRDWREPEGPEAAGHEPASDDAPPEPAAAEIESWPSQDAASSTQGEPEPPTADEARAWPTEPPEAGEAEQGAWPTSAPERGDEDAAAESATEPEPEPAWPPEEPAT